MRPVTQIRTMAAADNDGICLAQTTAGAADLLLNGVLVTDGVAELGAQGQVVLESAADLSLINFTIEGTTDSGLPITEVLAGPNAAIVTTELNFSTVTRISVDAAVGTNVTVGTNGVGASEKVPLDLYISPFNVALAAIITDTVNATIQYTFDDVTASDGPYAWFDHTDLTAFTANAEGMLVGPVRAVRILTNSGTGTVRFEVLQAGAA